MFERNGLKVAIIHAPELVSFTHNALKENYPEVDITITTHFDFTDLKPRIHVSYRSYNGFHVGAFLKSRGIGGGNATGGGGSVPTGALDQILPS